jgi:VWFA-related protein
MFPAKLKDAREAVSQFFKIANPEDEAFLVQFNDTATLAQGFTGSLPEIQNHLQFTQSKGMTALLDAIYLALNEMRKSRLRRKALLIVSDGGDNASRYTQNEVNRLLQESDVLIYAIGIFTPFGPRRTLEELAGPDLLRKISERSGGRLIPISGTIELPYMAVKVGMEMRNRYLLGYSPGDILYNGRYHRVQVKLVPPPEVPPLHALWRTGYYAPAR